MRARDLSVKVGMQHQRTYLQRGKGGSKDLKRKREAFQIEQQGYKNIHVRMSSIASARLFDKRVTCTLVRLLGTVSKMPCAGS